MCFHCGGNISYKIDQPCFTCEAFVLEVDLVPKNISCQRKTAITTFDANSRQTENSVLMRADMRTITKGICILKKNHHQLQSDSWFQMLKNHPIFSRNVFSFERELSFIQEYIHTVFSQHFRGLRYQYTSISLRNANFLFFNHWLENFVVFLFQKIRNDKLFWF